jgi:hypothetical protein
MSYDHVCEANNLPTRACFHVVEVDTSIKANASKHTDTNSKITYSSAGSRVEGGTHIKVISLFILLLRLEAIRRQQRCSLSVALDLASCISVVGDSTESLN